MNARAGRPAASDPAVLARAFEAERTLLQLTSELATLRDPAAVLEQVIRAAGRLVDADGAILSRFDPADGLLHWGVDDGVHERFDPDYVAGLTLEIGVGLTGRAVAERRVLRCGRDLVDAFPHSPESDHFFEVSGFHSLLAAPIASASELFGALEVYAIREDAFDDADAALLEALAAQAAIALGNARLIAELATSRAELARRAEVEHALREIAARVSAAHDVDEVVGLAIDEATRLLGGDGARIDILQPDIALLRGVYTSAGETRTPERWPETPDERPDQGLAGQAYTRGISIWTGDYLADDGFPHASGIDAYVRSAGIRSVIASPLVGEGGPFGALSVYSTRPDAFGPEHAAHLEAIATHVAISLAGARLIDDLGRSKAQLARRVEQEQALREIGTRLMAVGQPDELLRRIVAEARRLLGADGSRIDLLDESTMRLRWAIADGATADADARLLREGGLRMGEGVAGRAVAEGRAVRTGDYLADPAIQPGQASARFVEETGVRSILSTPLPGIGRPLGALSVLAVRADAFGDEDAVLLDAFALQASIAITNARRLQALARATEENARRAATEKALREIAARIGALRDPTEIVQLTVDEAARLLGADGARIDVTGEPGVALRRRLGEVVSSEEFRLNFSDDDWERSPGVSGTAARLGRPFGTGDYLADHSFERGPYQDEGIRRLGVHSVLAAPVGGESGPIGALTVLSRRRNAFDVEAGATLDVLASLAAAALRNVTLEGELHESEARLRDLVAELRESEERYRNLVQTSPDGTWQADATGSFTFWSAVATTLTGYPPEAVIGRHWSVVVGDAAVEQARQAWSALESGRGAAVRVRLDLVHSTGEDLPAEIAAVPIVRDGRFAGAHGTLRDLREQLRLEREVRESEARFRELVQTSPDGVWQTDPEGKLVFWSDAARALLGWEPDDLIGRHWSMVVAGHAVDNVRAALKPLALEPPDAVTRVRAAVVRRDGAEIPAEISGVPLVRDGQFAGIQGTIRDLRPQVRLERELREQAGALAASSERAHLARELHDSVTQALFSMGLLTRSIEVLLDRDAAAARARLADLRELQRDALAEMRSLIFELRPGSLEREGLASALRNHVAAVEGRLGLPIVLDVEEVGRLPLAVEDALYRIAQEALHNIVKHAGAHTVHLQLARDGDNVILGIADDGVGFDPEGIADGHLGFAGMRSRAERIGARFVVRSTRGTGTEIQVALRTSGDASGPHGADGPPAPGAEAAGAAPPT